ncbi:MAG: Flp family type IVb pilin [Hamadaea sp.]|nr:Flp family type IVb pilin [Hamadaea sp.]
MRCGLQPELRDRGATAVEYAIILAAIAAVIFATVAALGIKVSDFFTTAEGLFP